MTTERINPQSVVEAFDQMKDLLPITGTYSLRDVKKDGKIVDCGCGLTALAKQRNPKLKIEYLDATIEIGDDSEELFGLNLSHSYLDGFTSGFDDIKYDDITLQICDVDSKEEYEMGYTDGHMAVTGLRNSRRVFDQDDFYLCEMCECFIESDNAISAQFFPYATWYFCSEECKNNFDYEREDD